MTDMVLMPIFLKEIIWFLQDSFFRGTKVQSDKGSEVFWRAEELSC